MTARYANGRIYAIRSLSHPELVYIGSTCLPLHQRLYKHRYCYSRWWTPLTCINPKYYTSYEVIKYEDHFIELIEEHPCQNKQQLRQREGQVIRETDCVNKRIAGRTRNEYYQDHKTHLLQRSSVRHQNNREKDNEYARRWYQENKEYISECNQAKYQANKAHFNEKRKARYYNNKKHVECEVCGCKVLEVCLTRHYESKKHLDALQVSNDCVSPALSPEGSTSSSEMASSNLT